MCSSRKRFDSEPILELKPAKQTIENSIPTIQVQER
jgi:hypothetical protein